jgi:hypothetical protein
MRREEDISKGSSVSQGEPPEGLTTIKGAEGRMGRKGRRQLGITVSCSRRNPFKRPGKEAMRPYPESSSL